jgi:hypothetical protein
MRLPGLFQELPPYQFCDEEFFWGEVNRMILSNSYLAEEFRAGGANIYPMFYLTKFINMFLPDLLRSTGVLIVGRLILVGVMGSLNIIIIKKICDYLFSNKVITKITIILYVISPYILSNSRIWYPDNYIFVFSAIFFLGLIKTLKFPSNISSYILLALGLAFTISTKYTGILLVLPAFLILFFNFLYVKEKTVILTNFALFLTIFLVFLLLLNYSILVNFEKFILAFNSNRALYSNHGFIDVNNFLYYFNFTFTMVLGVFSFPLWCFGSYYLIKISREKFAYFICLSIPLAYIIFLGSLGKVLGRNVSILIPFVLPIIGCGIYFILYRMNFTSYKFRLYAVILCLIFPQSLQSTYIVYHNFYPDSRIIAKRWLKKNISSSSSVGFNDACSGSSPALRAGLNAIFDPGLKLKLDYYVLNSYWPSFLDKYYFNRFGYLRIIDQKYIHFYEYESNEAFKFDRFKNIESASINNYSIIKIFQSNGPDVIILKSIL